MCSARDLYAEHLKHLFHRAKYQIVEHPLSIVISSLLLLFLIYYLATYDPRLRSLPPKVRGYPLINQTLYHLQDDLATNAIAWSRQYGEIYRTKSGTTNWIWLNSGEAVKELCDRKSVVYSSRMPTPMGSEAASGGRRMLFMEYGERWRMCRGIVHRLLTPRMTGSYAPAQTYEAKQLSVDLLDQPEGQSPSNTKLHTLEAHE